MSRVAQEFPSRSSSARSLSHRQKADIVQSTALTCGLCNVLKSLPASKSRVRADLAYIGSERLPWVLLRCASSGVPRACPAQRRGYCCSYIGLDTFGSCTGMVRNKSTTYRGSSQPWRGLTSHQGVAGSHEPSQSGHSPWAPISLPGDQTRPAVGLVLGMTAGKLGCQLQPHTPSS